MIATLAVGVLVSFLAAVAPSIVTHRGLLWNSRSVSFFDAPSCDA